ncbi:MAG TPA: hypothetical protein DDW90_02725 [Cyanobacteria bacterium UBA9971]|nr:hypothetical protein [Cyanobacteria bacterium UBA9971]
MKKAMLLFLLIIFLNCIFILTAISEENALKLIIGADTQFSRTNLEIVQQKINDLDKNINLTFEQQQKTDAIGKNSAKKLNIYKVKFIEEKNKLITMRKSGAPINQIQSQIKVVQSLKSRLNIIRKKNMREFEAILTLEQKTYFSQFKVDLQQIKEKEKHFNREKQEIQNRDESLKGLNESN